MLRAPSGAPLQRYRPGAVKPADRAETLALECLAKAPSVERVRRVAGHGFQLVAIQKSLEADGTLTVEFAVCSLPVDRGGKAEEQVVPRLRGFVLSGRELREAATESIGGDRCYSLMRWSKERG